MVRVADYVCTKCGWAGPESEAEVGIPEMGGAIARMVWCPRCPYQVIAIKPKDEKHERLDEIVSSTPSFEAGS